MIFVNRFLFISPKRAAAKIVHVQPKCGAMQILDQNASDREESASSPWCSSDPQIAAFEIVNEVDQGDEAGTNTRFNMAASRNAAITELRFHEMGLDDRILKVTWLTFLMCFVQTCFITLIFGIKETSVVILFELDGNNNLGMLANVI